ncbi:hypothetical protein BsWGS_20483 [Bradybaena similaris]
MKIHAVVMPASMFHILEVHTSCIYGVAIVMTIIALAISTRYSLRNLLNIHTLDDNVYAIGAKSLLGDTCSCDAAGNDGDDEADPDGEEEATMSEVSDSQQTFSNCQEHLQYYEYIQGETKHAEATICTGAVEKSVREQPAMEEEEVKQRQLKEIFRLMQRQQAQCDVGTVDKKL